MNYRVLYARRERVGELTLNQPPLNILDLETLEELGRRLEELSGDDGLQLLWLRAAGEEAFSAGSAVQDHAPERARAMLTTFHRALATLRRLPAITIAVVRGHCLGGGMELASCCDLVLAADDSRFGQPEVDLGCFPPVAAALYPARLGSGRTLELLLTGRLLSCAEAERLGLVTWRVPAAELDAKRRARSAPASRRRAPPSPGVSSAPSRPPAAGASRTPWPKPSGSTSRSCFPPKTRARASPHSSKNAARNGAIARWRHR